MYQYIALVDDNKDNIELLMVLLQHKLALALEGFIDPERALGRIAQHPPRLVIAAYLMQPVCGGDLLKSVLDIDPDIPVILIVNEMDELQEPLACPVLEKGVPGFYSKLLAVIEKLVPFTPDSTAPTDRDGPRSGESD